MRGPGLLIPLGEHLSQPPDRRCRISSSGSGDRRPRSGPRARPESCLRSGRMSRRISPRSCSGASSPTTRPKITTSTTSMRSIPEPTRLAKTRSARTSLALCLGIGVGLVGAAIWQFVYGITGAGSSKLATASVTASAVYPDYPNLRRLTNASTTVVRATAQLVHPSYREVPKGIPMGLLARKASAAGIIKTDVDFRVDHVIWGKAPNTLRVIHLGGNAAGQKLIVEGEPISKVGGSYVLFLRKQPDQKYGIVGGAQGRYAIRGGRLRLVSADVANAPGPRGSCRPPNPSVGEFPVSARSSWEELHASVQRGPEASGDPDASGTS